MNAEQVAAVERLRNRPGHGMYPQVYEDMAIVCDMYLSEHPADDGEIDRLRAFCRKQQEEIETLIGYADAVERLRDIGTVTGCDHVDSPDGRRQLVNCVEQLMDRLEDRIMELAQEGAAKSPPASKYAKLRAERDALAAKLAEAERLLEDAGEFVPYDYLSRDIKAYFARNKSTADAPQEGD